MQSEDQHGKRQLGYEVHNVRCRFNPSGFKEMQANDNLEAADHLCRRQLLARSLYRPMIGTVPKIHW